MEEQGVGWRGRLLLPNTNGDNRVRVDIPCHLIHAVKEGTVSNIQQLIKKKKKRNGSVLPKVKILIIIVMMFSKYYSNAHNTSVLEASRLEAYSETV